MSTERNRETVTFEVYLYGPAAAFEASVTIYINGRRVKGSAPPADATCAMRCQIPTAALREALDG